MRQARRAVAATIGAAAVSWFHASSAVAATAAIGDAPVRPGTARPGGRPSPAVRTSILVLPRRPHPGEAVHISVPDCSVGPTRNIARSAAFTRDVVLYGKADTGEADPRLPPALAPGTYAVVAFCGAGQTRRGQITVVTGPGGSGAAGTHAGDRSARPVVPVPGTKITAWATPAPMPSAGHHGPGAVAWLAGAGAALAGAATLALLRRRGRP